MSSEGPQDEEERPPRPPYVESAAEKKSALEKAKKKRDRTAYIRNIFNLSTDETVIQNYQCKLKGSLFQGRLYLTQNYLLYTQKMPTKLIQIPFRKIKAVAGETMFLFWYLVIDYVAKGTQPTKCILGGFQLNHGTEALNLANYLWNNQPSYVDMAEIENLERQDRARLEEKRQAIAKAEKAKSDAASNPFDDAWGSGSAQATKSSGVQVDRQATKDALRLAEQALQTGSETLVELSRQADQLDQIENTIEGIHGKLDYADRLLRGIESLPAYIGQNLGKSKPLRVKRIVADRKLNVKKGAAPTMDVEILCKLPNDSLVEAILSFGGNGVSCLNPETEDLLLPQHFYKYSDISAIVLRARHEHCDLRFFPDTKMDRFRMMSSYLQIIVNEFILRTPKGQIQVIFEPGAHKFGFGRARISVQPPLHRDAKSGAGSGFFRRENQIKTSSLLGAEASLETREALDEADKDLDAISGILGQLVDVGVTMGDEIDRQTDQLDRINKRVDDGNARLKKDINRMDRVIDG
eukprot:TRINITY_DN8659_c0_g1_i1.p1 TRINITY_DN8659_c0_g1~~TRINITY_DN8659_c0_g1_i1.p1  ORF type:complete len:574 (-),score=121.68 TRINITY_DN8659_c0_g1_i1:37-1605(-)